MVYNAPSNGRFDNLANPLDARDKKILTEGEFRLYTQRLRLGWVVWGLSLTEQEITDDPFLLLAAESPRRFLIGPFKVAPRPRQATHSPRARLPFMKPCFGPHTDMVDGTDLEN